MGLCACAIECACLFVTWSLSVCDIESSRVSVSRVSDGRLSVCLSGRRVRADWRWTEWTSLTDSLEDHSRCSTRRETSTSVSLTHLPHAYLTSLMPTSPPSLTSVTSHLPRSASLTDLVPTSHPPPTHLPPTSHPPPTHLTPTSHPPHTHLTPTSHPPHTHRTPTSHPPHTHLTPP